MTERKTRLRPRIAGFLLLVLFVASGAALLRVVLRAPDFGRPPPLAAVVDGGKMEDYLESDAEKQTILRWASEGAPRRGWPDVETIFENRCVSCHFTGNERFNMLALDSYDAAALAATVRPVLLEKISGGTMGKYLETLVERDALVQFIEHGAPETEWPEARKILNAHCVACHNPEGVAGLPHLDVLPPVARLAAPPERKARSFGVVAVPLAGLFLSVLGLLVLRTRRKVPS